MNVKVEDLVRIWPKLETNKLKSNFRFKINDVETFVSRATLTFALEHKLEYLGINYIESSRRYCVVPVMIFDYDDDDDE